MCTTGYFSARQAAPGARRDDASSRHSRTPTTESDRSAEPHGRAARRRRSRRRDSRAGRRESPRRAGSVPRSSRTGGLHEPRKLLVGHFGRVHPEPVHVDAMNRVWNRSWPACRRCSCRAIRRRPWRTRPQGSTPCPAEARRKPTARSRWSAERRPRTPCLRAAGCGRRRTTTLQSRSPQLRLPRVSEAFDWSERLSPGDRSTFLGCFLLLIGARNDLGTQSNLAAIGTSNCGYPIQPFSAESGWFVTTGGRRSWFAPDIPWAGVVLGHRPLRFCRLRHRYISVALRNTRLLRSGAGALMKTQHLDSRPWRTAIGFRDEPRHDRPLFLALVDAVATRCAACALDVAHWPLLQSRQERNHGPGHASQSARIRTRAKFRASRNRSRSLREHHQSRALRSRRQPIPFRRCLIHRPSRPARSGGRVCFPQVCAA